TRGVADTVNTNVINFAGKIWALVEAGAYPIELNSELESKRHHLFENEQDLPFTAHPHVDPETGDIHAVCYDALNQNKVFYLHIDAEVKPIQYVESRVKSGPLSDYCAIKQSQVLILDLNVHFSMRSALKRSMLIYQWSPEQEAHISILPFEGTASVIHWYEID